MKFQQFQITDLAESDSRPETKNLSLKYKRLPEIKIKPHQMNLDYQQNPPEIKAQPRYPQTQAQWGEVNTYLAQRPDIEIEIVGGNVNKLR